MLAAASCMGLALIIDTGGRNLPDMETAIQNRITAFEERLFPFKFSDSDTIRVVVTYTRDEFREATSGSLPDWGAGAAIPGTGTIVLLLGESSRSPRAMELISHEMAHIVLHRAVGANVRIPRWFDEGFAQWVSGPMAFQSATRLALANLLGESIPLRELESLNLWDSNKAELAYAESFAAFIFLVGILPNKEPYGLIAQIAAAGDFDSGFESFTGMTMPQFYSEWARIGSKRYNWSLILADWRISFLIITLMFVVLGTIKLVRIRNAKRETEYDIDNEKN